MTSRDTTINIGSLLLRIRLAKNMQQDILCENIMSQSMLSRIESDLTNPTFQKVYEILKKMDMDLSEFDYLLNQMYSGPDYFTKLAMSKAINSLDLVTVQFLLDSNNRVLPAYASQALSWITYCFGVNFKGAPQATFHYTTSMLNQDEFFNRDLPAMIYALPTLSFSAAFYCCQRIKAQIQSHQTKELAPHLLVDVSLTLGILYLNDKDAQQGIYYITEALSAAKSCVDIERMMIISLILFQLTQQNKFLIQAQSIKNLFSKDFSYNYWYNVIETKYSIEVKK